MRSFATRLGRLARDRLLAALYERELRKLGVPVSYTTGAGDNSTPEGQVFTGMQQLWDEFEVEKLRRETRRGMTEATKQGFRMGGRAPYGYRRKGTDLPDGHLGADKQRITLMPEPEEAKVVAEIFHLHAQGWGLKKIAEHLNRPDGPPPPRHVDSSRNRGAHWATSTLRSILRSRRQNGGGPKVRAQEDWVVTPDAHEPLVSAEAFQRSQERFGTRHSRQSTGAANSRSYLFAGMVYCCSGHQALSMQGKCRKRSPTYNCGYGAAYSENAAEEVHGGAKWVSLREDALLPLVEDFFAERVFGPMRIEKLAHQLGKQERSKATQDKLNATKLRSAIADADRKIKLAVRGLTAGVEPEAVQALIDELKAEKEVARGALAALSIDEVEAEHDYLAERLARVPDLGEQLRDATPEVKREFFQAFELRVEFDKANGRIGISATVSEAVAAAFEGTTTGTPWRVPVRDIAGAGFEPATFGL